MTVKGASLERTAFIIISCDTYSELWDQHFKCLDHYWPDCPFPRYLLTNHKNPTYPGITVLQIGDDVTWSANLKKALKRLRKDYDYIVATFDDLFLVQRVDTACLVNVLDTFHRRQGQFLQLVRWLKKIEKIDDNLGLIRQGSLYRPNCVYAYWRIEVLDHLLDPGESAWEFERKGAVRCDQFVGFYAVLNDVIHYRGIVVRGKILRKDAKMYNLRSGQKLRIMSRRDTVLFYLRLCFFRGFLFLIPGKYHINAANFKNKIKTIWA